MKIALFDKFKQLATSIVASVISHGRGTPTNHAAGRALFGHTNRRLTPQEWIRWYCGGNKRQFATPTKRSANDGRGDTYGAAQRRRAARPLRQINYRKQNNRVARALREFNGMPAQTWAKLYAPTRDPISGVVS